MKNRNFALCALGLAAAFTFGGAATASAQRTPSQTRIPVRKGETAPMETKVDTVRIVQHDTVQLPGRTETVTVTRVDTVTRMEMLPLQKLPGWYFGLGVGMDIPTASWLNVAKIGPNAHAHLGYFPGVSPLGIRFDGDWTSFGARDTDCPACSSTKLLSGSAQAVLRFPLDRKSPINPQIYFLGGGGIDKFSDFNPYRTGTNNQTIVTAGKDTYLAYPGLPLTSAQAGDKSMFYHWDVGGGFQLGKFFMEAKYVSVNTTGANSVHVPITLGLNF